MFKPVVVDGIGSQAAFGNELLRPADVRWPQQVRLLFERLWLKQGNKEFFFRTVERNMSAHILKY
jgi:hypothetical protein